MFSDEVNNAAKHHALVVWPKESVGLVINDEYHPVENTAEDPTKDFRIDAALMLSAGLQALIHSHPNGDNSPSEHDMRQQIATMLPWGIIATNGEKAEDPMWFGDAITPAPLIGRPFRFGPSGTDGKGDCYALIRDWFWENRKVRLKEVPRDMQGYSNLTPWYDTLFSSYGWEEVNSKDAKEGDVLLCKIMQNVTNHAILILDHGYCLHHTQNKLSRREPIGPWLRYAVRVVRYSKP